MNHMVHACRCMRSSAFLSRSSSSKAFSRQAPNAASSSTLLRGSCKSSACARQLPQIDLSRPGQYHVWQSVHSVESSPLYGSVCPCHFNTYGVMLREHHTHLCAAYQDRRKVALQVYHDRLLSGCCLGLYMGR